ncbi:hypothetical protein CF336_g9364 [Tilletia laevis]|nr:hypothetical protein CF336_g9364 [Tilletia laevis]
MPSSTRRNISAWAPSRNVCRRLKIAWTKLVNTSSPLALNRSADTTHGVLLRLWWRRGCPLEFVSGIVQLRAPFRISIDPVFNIEQIDIDTTADDPFVADRTELPVDPRVEDTVDSAGLSDSLTMDEAAEVIGDADPALPPRVRRLSDSLTMDEAAEVIGDADPALPPRVRRLSDSLTMDEAAEVIGDADPTLPPRVRRHPAALGDFVLGTVRSSAADELDDLLRGPLPRPRIFQDGNDRLLLTEGPVAFLSRLTSPAESKLVAAELELVCFTWAHRKLAHLLEGAFTTVITDHSPMERMLRSTTNIPYGPTITRCRAEIMPHLANLRFLYRPGARHTNADALSRLPVADQGRSASDGGDVLATSS